MELIKLSNKFMVLSNLSINHLQKELTKYHSPNKNGSNFCELKSFCFLQHDQQDSPQVFPKVLLGTNTN